MGKPLNIPIPTKPRAPKPMQFFNIPVDFMPKPKKRSKTAKGAGEKMLLKNAMLKLDIQEKMKKQAAKAKAKAKKKETKKKESKKKESKKKQAVKTKQVKKVSKAKPVPTRRVLEATPTAGRRGTGYKWQFVENDKTWRDYATDASAVVEQHYHEWEGTNEKIVRAVKSGDWSYDVCFKAMQQTNADHHNHNKRRIRRVAQGTPPGQSAK